MFFKILKNIMIMLFNIVVLCAFYAKMYRRNWWSRFWGSWSLKIKPNVWSSCCNRQVSLLVEENKFETSRSRVKWSFSFKFIHYIIFKILNVIFYSYKGHTICFTPVILHLISPPLAFELLACLMNCIILNAVKFRS